MKKALQTILIVMMSLLALVSCSLEKAISDELVSATLISTDRVSKALETEVNFDLNAVKLWKYTARKANGGLTTGQTELGEDNAATLNSDGTTTGLSQGAWNFVLYGYDAAESGNLIAQGSINNATVITTNHKVTITVNPLQTSGATGKIVISNDIAIVSSDSKTTYKTGTQGYTMNYKVYKSSDTTMSNPETNLDSLAVGSYKVVVTFDGTVNGESYTAAKAEKVVNVYAGLTTTVKGTIGETEQAALLNQESGVYFGSKNETVTADTASNGLTMITNVSPVGTAATTSVEIPSNALSLTEGNVLELTVVATEVETESSTFILVNTEETNPVLGALDITLKVGEEEKKTAEDLNNKELTITTTVAKDLNGGVNYKYSDDDNNTTCSIQVKYNGSGDGGTVKEYNASTGVITFTVKHLSTYYIVDENVVAYNSTLSTAYTSLADAVTAADTANTSSVIELLCDSDGNGLMTADGNGNKITGDKTIIVDFNNHTYNFNGTPVGSGSTQNQVMHWGTGHVANVTLKNGTLTITDKEALQMAMQNYLNFSAENMSFDFSNMAVKKYDSTYSEPYKNQERAVWSNNKNGTITLKSCTVKTNSESATGINEGAAGTILEDTKVEGAVSISGGTIITKGTTTITKNEGKVISYLDLCTFSTETTNGVTTYTYTGEKTNES